MLKWCLGLGALLAVLVIEVQICGLWWTAWTPSDQDGVMASFLLMLGTFVGLGALYVRMGHVHGDFARTTPKTKAEIEALEALWDEIDAPYFDGERR
jgi:hypothetical protein